jgi:hypothetical protein
MRDRVQQPLFFHLVSLFLFFLLDVDRRTPKRDPPMTVCLHRPFHGIGLMNRGRHVPPEGLKLVMR